MSDVDLSIDLPEQSVLTEDEYREMYTVACEEPTASRLQELYDASPDGLEMKRGDDETIDTLLDVGLAKQHLFHGTYTIHITTMGRVLIEEGAEQGIQQLINAEYDFLETYSSDS